MYPVVQGGWVYQGSTGHGSTPWVHHPTQRYHDQGVRCARLCGKTLLGSGRLYSLGKVPGDTRARPPVKKKGGFRAERKRVWRTRMGYNQIATGQLGS